MSLQFYIGNSGSGKSYTLYQQVLKAAGQNSRHQYIVLVPEQFTMQTQKSFVSMSPSHGILNIDILSALLIGYLVRRILLSCRFWMKSVRFLLSVKQPKKKNRI